MKPRYVVLTQMTPDTATIICGDSSLELPLQLLDEFWLRRAFIFWKDFERVNETLQTGDRGGGVVWLQAALQTLGFYSGKLSGIYEGTTAEAVRAFQREHNLLLDGIVGPRTRLVLYGNLDRYTMPRLNTEDI
jgi:hypothetical protein